MVGGDYLKKNLKILNFKGRLTYIAALGGIKAETNLLNVNVEYFNANKNYLINYFNLLALDGSLIKLFEEYLPSYN
jgi:NADPH:quinone reductase-like Zn-dependent oxidoreductase